MHKASDYAQYGKAGIYSATSGGRKYISLQLQKIEHVPTKISEEKKTDEKNQESDIALPNDFPCLFVPWAYIC